MLISFNSWSSLLFSSFSFSFSINCFSNSNFLSYSYTYFSLTKIRPDFSNASSWSLALCSEELLILNVYSLFNFNIYWFYFYRSSARVWYLSYYSIYLFKLSISISYYRLCWSNYNINYIFRCIVIIYSIYTYLQIVVFLYLINLKLMKLYLFSIFFLNGLFTLILYLLSHSFFMLDFLKLN
jgi:hypothetical protein